jgi:predicted acyl esterase
VPGQPVNFTIDLHQQLYRFRKGHRLMVQVQSSWFPLYDRNPQSYVANISRAPAAAYRRSEHRIWRSGKHPSHLVLPVLPRE